MIDRSSTPAAPLLALTSARPPKRPASRYQTTSASARSPGSSHRKRLTAKPARTTRPLRSSPITGPSPLLQDGPPLCPAPVLSPSQFPLLGDLPCATTAGHNSATGQVALSGATGSHVPCKSQDHARATSTPDTTWPINRHPPGSSRGSKASPVSMPPKVLRRVISGSLALAFVIHTCRAHGATFPATLTTTALDRSSSGRFAASACTATAEGHQNTTPGSSISCTAPASSDLISYIQPPSTFVAHLRTTTTAQLRSHLTPALPWRRRRQTSPGACSRPSSRASVRPGSPETTASTGSSSAPVDRPHPCAPLSCMDTSSQGFAAASDECSSGAASDRVPPGACSSSLAEISAITRRTLTIERASDGLGPTRRTDLFSPYGVRSSRESR